MDTRQQHAERVAELFHTEYPRLCNYVARKVQKQNAEDMVSRAFVRLLSVPDPERISQIRPYLYRMVQTEVFCAQRSYAVRARLILKVVCDNVPSTEEDYVEREQLRLLTEAIALLPDLQRRALTLVYSGGMTQLQAAQKIGVSLRHCKRLIARALGAIQRHLDVVPSDNTKELP